MHTSKFIYSGLVVMYCITLHAYAAPPNLQPNQLLPKPTAPATARPMPQNSANNAPNLKKYDQCCICQFDDGDEEIRDGVRGLCDKWLAAKSCDYKIKIARSEPFEAILGIELGGFANQCNNTALEHFGHGHALSEGVNDIKACFRITANNIVVKHNGCSTFNDSFAVLKKAEDLKSSMRPGQTLEWSGNQAAMEIDTRRFKMLNTTYATLNIKPNRFPEMIFPKCDSLGEKDPSTAQRTCTSHDAIVHADAACLNTKGLLMHVLCCPIMPPATFLNKIGFGQSPVFNWVTPDKPGSKRCPGTS